MRRILRGSRFITPFGTAPRETAPGAAAGAVPNGPLAGLIAGPSMLLTGPGAQHSSLAIYILMRAAVLASRCGIKSKRFGKICKLLTWSNGDIFLMCLSVTSPVSDIS
jgi:hypothetical protein